jgi:hypothetical protein
MMLMDETLPSKYKSSSQGNSDGRTSIGRDDAATPDIRDEDRTRRRRR